MTDMKQADDAIFADVIFGFHVQQRECRCVLVDQSIQALR